MTTLSELSINGTDRKSDHFSPIKITRRMNAVGDIEFLLDNDAGTYDSLIDPEHDPIEVDINSNRIFYGHVYDADHIAEDKQSRFKKFVKVSGRDQAEELLFFDDFEYEWTDPDTTIQDVLDDIFNNLGLTFYHIQYSPVGSTTIGAVEKKDGQSLLAFLQEIHKNAGYCFYVSDLASGYKGDFVSKALASLNSTGVTLSRTNLVGDALIRKKTGAKLYNYIKLYGKNPQFDAWTEFTASNWDSDGSSLADETSHIRVGKASIKATSLVSGDKFTLDFASTLFNYTSLNLAKGDFGLWTFYQGDPSPSNTWRLILQDVYGKEIHYEGVRTTIYENYWGWISGPIGISLEKGASIGSDKWFPVWDKVTSADFTSLAIDADNGSGRAVLTAASGTPFNTWEAGDTIIIWNAEDTGNNGVYVIYSVTSTVLTLTTALAQDNAEDTSIEIDRSFDWEHIEVVSVQTEGQPDFALIDGLTLPVAPLSIYSQVSYSDTDPKRALVLQRPDITTQNALDKLTAKLYDAHKDGSINLVKAQMKGNTSLVYGGTTLTVNIANLVSSDTYYINELTHVICPRMNMGYGHDFLTSIEAVKVDSVAYDLMRLSPASIGGNNYPGIGLKVK